MRKKRSITSKKDYKQALRFEELYSQHRRDYANAKNKTYLSKIQDEFLFEKQRKSKTLEEQSKVYRNILLLILSLLSL